MDCRYLRRCSYQSSKDHGGLEKKGLQIRIPFGLWPARSHPDHSETEKDKYLVGHFLVQAEQHKSTGVGVIPGCWKALPNAAHTFPPLYACVYRLLHPHEMSRCQDQLSLIPTLVTELVCRTSIFPGMCLLDCCVECAIANLCTRTVN